MMKRKFSKIRSTPQKEYLLQKHIRSGRVNLDYVVPINIILALIFMIAVGYIFGRVFDSVLLATIWIGWGFIGAVLADKIKTVKWLHNLLGLIATLCVKVTAHFMNAAYWLFAKIFKTKE